MDFNGLKKQSIKRLKEMDKVDNGERNFPLAMRLRTVYIALESGLQISTKREIIDDAVFDALNMLEEILQGCEGCQKVSQICLW